MRVLLEPQRRTEGAPFSGGLRIVEDWKASVEYGENMASNFVAYGPDPTAAALNLAKYLAKELIDVREKASRL